VRKTKIRLICEPHPSSSTLNQSKYLPAIDQVDNNDEIITFISGSTFEGIAINRWGILRDVDIYAIFGGTGLDIEGWKRNPTERFFYSGVNSIHASHFLGFSIPTKPTVFVIGIAFGNIEWSM